MVYMYEDHPYSLHLSLANVTVIDFYLECAHEIKSDRWGGTMWAAVGQVSKHAGVRGFEELDVVLKASVGAVWLLQAIFHVLQSASVPPLHLGTINAFVKDQLRQLTHTDF